MTLTHSDYVIYVDESREHSFDPMDRDYPFFSRLTTILSISFLELGLRSIILVTVRR